MAHRTALPPTRAVQRSQPGRDALAESLKAFEAKPSYAACKALILHYSHCPACADGTNPCTEGEPLRQAWKAMRWS
jgi:hypothetical protein